MHTTHTDRRRERHSVRNLARALFPQTPAPLTADTGELLDAQEILDLAAMRRMAEWRKLRHQTPIRHGSYAEVL